MVGQNFAAQSLWIKRNYGHLYNERLDILKSMLVYKPYQLEVNFFFLNNNI